MRKQLIIGTLLLAALAASLGPSPGYAQERIAIGINALEDGNCPIQRRITTGEYGRTTDAMLVRGFVRTAPAGGDCRLDTFSYDVRVARYFKTGGVDATVEFSAAEESTAAAYVLAGENGAVLTRADGGALFGSTLPAGSAQTIVAAVGISKQVGIVRLGAAVNLAPIDWAGHDPGRTARLTWDLGWRGIYAEGAVDVGVGHFGVSRVGYRHGLGDTAFELGAGVTRRWGLAAVDNGAPLTQQIADATFLRDGPPAGSSTLFEVTVGYRIGG